MQVLLRQDEQIHLSSSTHRCIPSLSLQDCHLTKELASIDIRHRHSVKTINQHICSTVHNEIHLRAHIALLDDHVSWWHMKVRHTRCQLRTCLLREIVQDVDLCHVLHLVVVQLL